MMRRYRLLVAAALMLSLAVLSGFATSSLLGSAEDNEVMLPTACENLVDATELLAEHGSGATIPMSGTDVFAEDPDAGRYETLKTLLDACDAQLAMMAPE